MLRRFLPLLLLLAGCPDPTASPDGAGMSDKPMGGPGGPGGPGGEGGPGMGGPGQGGPGMGGPGQGGQMPSGRPTPTGFQIKEGQTIKLSGTVSYTGSKTGTFTIDFLKQNEGSNFPDLVHSLTLDKPGPWEVQAPKDGGSYMVVCFLDGNGNGPEPTEPAGRIKEQVTLGQADITGLDIAVSDNPELGELKPGGGGGEGAPGQGGPGGPGGPGMGGPGGPNGEAPQPSKGETPTMGK